MTNAKKPTAADDKKEQLKEKNFKAAVTKGLQGGRYVMGEDGTPVPLNTDQSTTIADDTQELQA